VFRPGLGDVQVSAAGPGEEVRAVTAGAEAVLVRSPEAEGLAVLSLGRYVEGGFAVPGHVVMTAFDVRLTNAHGGDRLTLTFAFPPGALGDLRLHFFDPASGAFRSVMGSLHLEDSVVIDRARGTVTVVLDATSLPAVTDLHGTVFTVSVTGTETRVSVLTPALATAGSPRGFGTAASFTSTTQRTLTLAPSQGTTLITSQAQVGADAVLAGDMMVERPGAGEDNLARDEPWPLGDDPFAHWQPDWALRQPPASEEQPAEAWPLGAEEAPRLETLPYPREAGEEEAAVPPEMEWSRLTALAVGLLAAGATPKGLDHKARGRGAHPGNGRRMEPVAGGALRDPRLRDATPSG
jgi:hypothetical protein